MSLDPPAYISSLQNNIRARPISWEGAVRAKTITDEDLKKIKAIDKVRKEQRKQTIEGDVKTYTQLLLGGDNVKSIFESAAKRTDILQYMLVLAGDLVDGMFLASQSDLEQEANHSQRHTRSHQVPCSTPGTLQAAHPTAEAVSQPGRPHSSSCLRTTLDSSWPRASAVP